MDNKTLLLTLIIVLVVFIVLLAVLGIVFIIALRKRRPVIKVVMAPNAMQDAQAEDEPEQAPAPAPSVAEKVAPVVASTESVAPQPVVPPAPAKPAPEPEPEDEEEDDDDDAPLFVTEGQERVSYNRSLTAKLAQMNNKSKEWYSQVKNELLSYDKVKVRMSWKRETFRIGRLTVAKLIVRGKTLCLLLAVEPASYAGTKFSVRDMSHLSSMADTPTMYRIRKDRRCKYAKEMIADVMKELKVYKNPAYEAQDYFVPYEGDVSLMQRGLVKRVVSGTIRAFKIEEVDHAAIDEAAAASNNNNGDGDKA
ncbi:MAG: hypothetical protein K2K13_02900 [Clostridiales bacterium]|nr:hypothetical protein [Clostridiales bacterium]